MNRNYSDYDNELFVSIYDYDNPNGPDHDFYRKLADDNNAKSIVEQEFLQQHLYLKSVI